MKLKQLEGLLGGLEQFYSPKIDQEPYPTGTHIASRQLFMAENTYGDISGKAVAVFGCGCGTLGIAAAFLGAEYVIGVDIDPISLDIAAQSAEDLEVASLAVYSLHKTTTRDHVRRTALREFNAKSADVLCELRFDVPQLYKFHKEVDIAVDVRRFIQ